MRSAVAHKSGTRPGLARYGYDSVGNLTSVTYPVSPALSAAYDADSRLTNLVDGLGTHTFTWTAWGALASEGGLWPSDTVTYGYNTSLLRQTVTLLQPNGPSLTQSYGYDSDWRMTNITSSLAGTFSYFYPGANREVQQLNLPNASYITNTYDSLGRLQATGLKNSANTVLDSEAYQYNSAHNRIAQMFAAGNYVNYGYDALGQLLSALGRESSGASRWQEQLIYGYDPAGNLTTRTNNLLVQTFTFSNNDNQINTATRTGAMTVAGQVQTTNATVTVAANGYAGQAAAVYGDWSFVRTNVGLVDGTNTFTAVAQDYRGRLATNTVTAWLPASSTYTYDLNGNLTSDGRRSFEYDDANQLTAVQVTNAWRSEFQYDGLGRRRVRREYSWSSAMGNWRLTNQVRYVYDGMAVVQERDGNNVPQITYTRGLDLSGMLQRAGGIGGLLARTDHQEAFVNPQLATTFYHSDGGGNIMMLVDGNQRVAARYHYDPFGNLIGESGSLADANVYRFSSKEFAVNAGLYYYGFRFYDPNLQRWVNRDPIEEWGGINLYAYVANNPYEFVDLYGFSWMDFHWYNPISWYWPGYNGPTYSPPLPLPQPDYSYSGLRAQMGFGINNDFNGLTGAEVAEKIGWAVPDGFLIAASLPLGFEEMSGSEAFDRIPAFKRWFHKKWKKPNVLRCKDITNPNASREALDEAYSEWLERGQPEAK